MATEGFYGITIGKFLALKLEKLTLNFKESL